MLALTRKVGEDVEFWIDGKLLGRIVIDQLKSQQGYKDSVGLAFDFPQNVVIIRGNAKSREPPAHRRTG